LHFQTHNFNRYGQISAVRADNGGSWDVNLSLFQLN
jgi:hypothetical protein